MVNQKLALDMNKINKVIKHLLPLGGVSGGLFLLIAVTLCSCSDACEYKDTDTNNPSWIEEAFNDSVNVPHPDNLNNTLWVRTPGMKKNVYGQDILGYVDTLYFKHDETNNTDSVHIMMNKEIGIENDNYTMTDESNDTLYGKGTNQFYECTYSNITGKVEVLKRVEDEKGKVSKSTIFTGIAVISTRNSREVMTICHYGDVPVQTYLVKQ